MVPMSRVCGTLVLSGLVFRGLATSLVNTTTAKMPLHLLQHKSYHVYSTTNIERVQRDEAAARAKEEAEEQRMQEADAEHRMRVLRARAEGIDTPVPIRNREEPLAAVVARPITPNNSYKSETTIAGRPAPPPPDRPRKTSPALTGADGHINLFSDLEKPNRRNKVEKNAEHEAEKKAKEEKLEAQYTMGLGKPAEELKPWYSTLDMVGEVKGRKKTDREIRKDDKGKDWRDPLVAIRRGVRGVKEAEEAREEWKRTKELEVGSPAGLAALDSGRTGGAIKSREKRQGRDRSPEIHHDRSRRRGSGIEHQNHLRKHSRHESTTETKPHRHRRRHRSSRSRSPHCGSSLQNDPMEKLRRERDERETVERRKAEIMLNKEKEHRLPGWEAAGGGRYSSQFGIGEVRRR